ncbi:SusC/RagA family TonB-linked outer membrane protein [Pedobacter nutrimenti]|uniref:SusC/RagA family TonB-linked outer membrane protein n=1 Tax=Pedobacter nutrimenti TaxID=1241337 RepID=UPI00292E241D|nr:SusC/RagA family TonB-linked outer membrane protein [Pedobacter nutrimenti]
MRLIIIIMTTCLLQVSASSFGQQVTLSEKSVSLEKIFQLIRQQTGYDFLYDGKEIQSAKPVDVNFKNLDLRGALKKCLEDQGFDFEIGDKSVVVTKRTSSLMDRIAGVLTNIDVRGRITDENGNALSGAVIKVKGANRSTSANDKGEFFLGSVDEKAVLIIAYVGYETREIPAEKDLGVVALKLANNALEEVNVTVNTGYQTLPKERATGSFSFVDNKLLNRSVSTNVLDRLDGVTSGLIFNKQANKIGGDPSSGGDPIISIRGRSTIFANTEPLIVLDNFPYEGDLSNINPNDIESVTVLKDAAAASIWGVRAANGVIVLTSKKGKTNQRAKISLNTNIMLFDKPDVYSVPQMSSKDYIYLEKFFFDKGKYDGDLNNQPFFTQSPVIDILDKEKTGKISHSDAASQLSALSNIDNRSDYSKYFLRKALNQQYALSISGGSQSDQYYISGGFDRNLASEIPNSYNRFTINAKNTYQLLGDKLEFTSELRFAKSKTEANPNNYRPSYPYEQLVGSAGQALPVIRDWRQASKDALSNIGLLDWNYYPYNERFNKGDKTDLSDYRIDLGLNYKVYKDILSLALSYLFQQGNTNRSVLNDQSSYNTRLLINQFAQIDPTGNITYPVPLGGTLATTNTNYKSSTGRIQLNYNQIFSVKHQVNAIGGFEVRDNNSFDMSNLLYGYNPDNASSVPVDYFTNFNTQIGGNSIRIPDGSRQNGSTDRFISYYVNAAYTYNNKYTVTASGRRDESNLFGVEANQKGVPLYSFGISWDLSKEAFYHLDFLPYLKIRLTDGYSGNLSKNLSAYTTAQIAYINQFDALTQQIINPPNAQLRWEKVHLFNAGIDYASKNNRISGSIDVYSKKAMDLIGNSPIAAQTGVTQFTGNTANMLTKGMDVMVNSINLNGRFGWTTNFLFNLVRNKITAYQLQTGVNDYYVNQNYSNPLVGKPYAAILAYPWAGLDNTGDPQGFLDGKLSKDYAAIENSTNLDNLKFIGTSTPTLFGSLRNNLTYKNLDLSFNITYKFGYYFRRGSYQSSALGYQQADFEKRWQKPGDENVTIVPALKYPLDVSRDVFFNGSEALIEKGDHIRLQDIQIGYTFKLKHMNQFFSSLRLYGYVNNLGVIWRANKLGLDPDYAGGNSYSIPNPRSFSLGLNLNL